MKETFDSVFRSNSAYVDDLFSKYQRNKNNVSPEWQYYFDGFSDGFRESSSLLEKNGRTGTQQPIISLSSQEGWDGNFELKCHALVQAYQTYGHLSAQINPLPHDHLPVPELETNSYQLSQKDLAKNTIAGVSLGMDAMPLKQLIAQLKNLYCGTIAVEYQHISNQKERSWIATKWISQRPPLKSDTQLSIYHELARADALEKTIATKYIGKKRFSIEGADAQIPACESFLDEAVRLGAKECNVAIAHRGRLNFLVHVIQKPLENLFAEWEGVPHEALRGEHDVKYHLGYESIRKTRGGQEFRIHMPCNPSHLEFVDSTVMGDSRARQDLYYNSDKNSVATIVFHGDAAISGQGIVYECAQMMSLDGYKVGGTVHVVANNQVGFTTNPRDSRSSHYCTDIAKVTESPVFHVNSQDLDGLHHIMTLCAQYTHTFQKDAYVEILCFRRYGHNEGDEPSFTQPVLYQTIKKMKAPYEDYADLLVKKGSFSAEELNQAYQEYRDVMNGIFDNVKAKKLPIVQCIPLREAGKLDFVNEKDQLTVCQTATSLENIQSCAEKLCTFPDGFHVNAKLARILIQERKLMGAGEKPVDWGMGELLAYGTLLQEGFSIRLVGEDVQRGTFSHRHAVLVDAENEERFSPLTQINNNTKVEFINSLLSEEAAMGYEYGYAVRNPNCLTLWEGQFGDFANGAQVIVDQFLSAGETKWQQQCGLVLLLPHGMEGQGAEHSSARIERYLQLCAQGNMTVCAVTRSSQLFHLLRRQMHRNYRKPLILMTPKAFLRSPQAAAPLTEFTSGQFEEILDDSRIKDPKSVQRIVLCSGKMAIDLLDAIEGEAYQEVAQQTALVRLEQIYPLHTEKLKEILKKYPAAQKIFWVQEEPKNSGIWNHIFEKLYDLFEAWGLPKVAYVGRSARPAPAVGLEKLHAQEQKNVTEKALRGNGTWEV